MPSRLSPFELAEVMRLRLLLERVQGMPDEVLKDWAAPGFWKAEHRDRAVIARRELAWRLVGGDVPFR